MVIEKSGPLVFLLLSLLLIAIPSTSVRMANAHVGEGGGWLLSSYVSGDLTSLPNPSSAQWKEARMMMLEGVDIQPTSVMTVHNETYIVFLIQRVINNSVDRAGALIAFEGVGVNKSDVVWAWVGGKNVSPREQGVSSDYALTGGELTVVFGRALNSTTSAIALSVGKPYDDFVKITSWSTGVKLDSIDLDSLVHLNFELLPHLNVYPTAPLGYSALLLAVTLGFVWEESRKYR